VDVTYALQNVEFEWDERKARTNFEKHGVTFEEAAEAFFDPFYQAGDASVDDEESREFIIGYSLSQRLLLVVYRERDERTRIISARRGLKESFMKNDDETEGIELNVRARPTEAVSIDIPKDTLASLKSVADQRDMSVTALIKFYVGQGLRHDLSRLFGYKVLETAAHVLARHIESEQEVSSILREIRSQAAP
jgi:uncharacterized protein